MTSKVELVEIVTALESLESSSTTLMALVSAGQHEAADIVAPTVQAGVARLKVALKGILSPLYTEVALEAKEASTEKQSG